MTATAHLSDSALAALVLRPGARLPAGARAHLEFCRQCTGDLDDLRLFAHSVREATCEPPREVLERVYAMVEPEPPSRAERSGYAPARLIYDGGGASVFQPAGLRAPSGARHQVWRSNHADVDLRIQGPGLGSRSILVGQVLPRARRSQPAGSGTLWLFEPGQPMRVSTLTHGGEFSLAAPESHRWTLWIEWGALHLKLEKR